MSHPILIRTDTGFVAHLQMNSPDSLNALSDAMLAALAAELARLANDGAIRAVVLSGAGRAFCAGHDLREMQATRDGAEQPAADSPAAARFADLFARCAGVMQAVVALPQPVIAACHGIATAAGCQLAASCDMVVAAEGTRFGVNGVNIGLFCSTPMVALTRKVPPAVAFEMLTTGAFIDAARAREVGLVNRIAPAGEHLSAAMDLAQTVAARLPAAVRLGKRAFREMQGLDLAAAYDRAGRTMVENILWRDTGEGIAAFLDKRPPDWS